MTTLKELRDTLLRVDHPERILLLADSYLSQMEKMGDNFRLPKEHALVKPILEYYANDLEGWVKFVKGVRDRLPTHGRQFHSGVQSVYRTLEIRLTQQERRVRLDAAVNTAVKKRLIEDSYDVKMRYARRCTQAWQLRRATLLKNAANSTKSGKVTVAEREQLLEEFWRNIDLETQNGEVPKP